MPQMMPTFLCHLPLTLADRIEKALSHAGKAPSDIASELKVDPSTVYRWVRGESTPYQKSLRAVADATGVSFDWLWKEQGEMLSPSQENGGGLRSADSPVRVYRESPTGTGRVLQVYDFKAAASEGDGGYFINEDVIGEYVVDYTELQGMQDGHGFVIPVVGRSMVPDFRPGDKVICMRYRQGWDNLRDAVYLIRLEDVVYIKALQRLPGRRLRVISRNMDEFPPFEVYLDDEPDLEVLAVVWGKFERYYK